MIVETRGWNYFCVVRFVFGDEVGQKKSKGLFKKVFGI